MKGGKGGRGRRESMPGNVWLQAGTGKQHFTLLTVTLEKKFRIDSLFTS